MTLLALRNLASVGFDKSLYFFFSFVKQFKEQKRTNHLKELVQLLTHTHTHVSKF